MAINSTSASLGSAQALATQVDALATAIAAINAGTTGVKGSAAHNALIARQALAQTDLVNALLASSRLVPASVVTSCSVPLTAEQSSRITTYGTQETKGNLPTGFADNIRREAVQNAMNTGTVSAASVLSTMT